LPYCNGADFVGYYKATDEGNFYTKMYIHQISSKAKTIETVKEKFECC